MSRAFYPEDINSKHGYYTVVYIVRATGKKLAMSFDSPYKADKFINKLKHSTRCDLVSTY